MPILFFILYLEQIVNIRKYIEKIMNISPVVNSVKCTFLTRFRISREDPLPAL